MLIKISRLSFPAIPFGQGLLPWQACFYQWLYHAAFHERGECASRAGSFLHDSFEKIVKDHVKLRVLTDPFTGYEGYIVRIDRDRQLVFEFGGYAVAIRGVHNEDFEVVE